MVRLEFLAIWVFCLEYSLSAPEKDLVVNLPGLNFEPNFKSYAGYLNASQTRKHFYWFVEHQFPSDSSPVLLWLNGGPGCSSLGGFLEELGPFHVSDNGNTLYENFWAWNKVGHVIFMESPAGVGFSYATDGVVETNDDQTAQDNYNALIDFFSNKFPELRQQNFYITGESYAGVYLPTLGVLLANDTENFSNFKGVAIGNGVLSRKLNDETSTPFLYYHGIISVEDYESFLNGQPIANKVIVVNPYDLYDDCYLDTLSNPTSKRSFIWNNMYPRSKTMRYLAKNRKTNVPLCEQVNNAIIYLNRPDVRNALHVESTVGPWAECSYFGYTPIYGDVFSQFENILQRGVKILVYNGDVDSACNIIMNQRFIQTLNLTSIDESSLKPWVYNGSFSYSDDSNAIYASNIGGYYRQYDEGLDFVSVRGSGHFVPTYKPREALQMIYNFINGQPYSTPVPFDIVPQPLVNGTSQ